MLVLERIDGSTMLTSLRRPWRMPHAARTLAELHARLHEIPFEDARLLHLDLHPDNVLLSSRGPVVIDWTNAGRRTRARRRADMGDLCDQRRSTGSRLHAALPPTRRSCGRSCRAPDAVAFRIADPNVTDVRSEHARAEASRLSEDLEATARRLVDEAMYMTLATADDEGRPWASPLWFAASGYSQFLWVSDPEARHSRNLTARPDVAIASSTPRCESAPPRPSTSRRSREKYPRQSSSR